MESTAATMAHKSSCGLSWAASLNSSLVTLFYTSCPWSWDAKHTSTARLLNLKFPLPGLPFPQIISWLTPSLPFQRGLLSLHCIKQQTGMQAHKQRCMHSSSLSAFYWLLFILIHFFSEHLSPCNCIYCSPQLEHKSFEGKMFVSDSLCPST